MFSQSADKKVTTRIHQIYTISSLCNETDSIDQSVYSPGMPHSEQKKNNTGEVKLADHCKEVPQGRKYF